MAEPTSHDIADFSFITKKEPYLRCHELYAFHIIWRRGRAVWSNNLMKPNTRTPYLCSKTCMAAVLTGQTPPRQLANKGAGMVSALLLQE